MKNINKKGQEEMVGFAFIVIIVAVVLIVFLSIAFSGDRNEGPQSFEIENFLQVMLTQTTDCFDGIKYLSIKQLMFDCADGEICEDSRFTCTVLEEYLGNVSDLSWNTGSDTLGYTLKVDLNGIPMIPEISVGNVTRNYRGASQNFSKNGNSHAIEFKAYN